MKQACPLCGMMHEAAVLAEVDWLAAPVIQRLADENPSWKHQDGACPACVQNALLHVLLKKGEAALHEGVQSHWPLDAEAAFGAIPTPLRMHADPRFNGKGVTLALVDAGFYPHPDLIQPRNRIRAWVDASTDAVQQRTFNVGDTPEWPEWNAAHDWQWHGLMTSAVAVGNGWLSHGFYRGLASEAELVLIQVRDAFGAITNQAITRALLWISAHAQQFNIRVVNLSLGGDSVVLDSNNPVDEAIAELVEQGIIVVAAAGNNGERRLIPPATAPAALTVGGLDDKNLFDDDDLTLWHSNYGEGLWGVPKPEVVAPSIWVVAPVLPGTTLADEAQHLFKGRGQETIEARIAGYKLVTPHYQHVDGTSFAAPLVSSLVACLLEANPTITPALTHEVLTMTAHLLPDVPRERQGAGAVHAGNAIALTLRDQHSQTGNHALTVPKISAQGITFHFHHHTAQSVVLLGSWNGWAAPGTPATPIEPGLWRAQLPPLQPGAYVYKFLLDGDQWVDDPANPHKAPDNFGQINSVLTVPD